MKKIITVALLMIMGISTMFAQRLGNGRLGGPYSVNRLDTYDMYYGFRIGYNVSNLRFIADDINPSAVSGMNFGIITGFPLGNSSVIFEPGLLYSVKGGKTKSETKNPASNIRTETYMHGLEIPLVLKYDLALPTMADVSFQPFFGGYFDMGLGGKIKKEDKLAANKDDQRAKLKTFSNRFKRFDAGLRMGVGVNIEFFYVELAYDLGLANLGRDTKAFTDVFPTYDNWEDEVKTGNFSINFGVNF